MIILTQWLHLPVAAPADVLAVEDAAWVVEGLGNVAEGDLTTDRGLHHLCNAARGALYLENSN